MIKLNQPLTVHYHNAPIGCPAKVISSLPDSVLVEVRNGGILNIARFNYDGSSFYGRQVQLRNAPQRVTKYVRWFEYKGDICASVYPTRECIIEQDKANVLCGKTLRIEEISQGF